MMAFVNARCAGSKVNEVKDIFSLPWDNDDPGAPAEADYSQMDRLKAMGQAILESGALG